MLGFRATASDDRADDRPGRDRGCALGRPCRAGRPGAAARAPAQPRQHRPLPDRGMAGRGADCGEQAVAQRGSGSASGSAAPCRRSAAVRAKRSSSARRRAAGDARARAARIKAGGVAVGHDQALVLRQELDGESGRDREVELVGEVQIVAPLAVGQEVGPAGLDLDRHQAAVASQRHQVHPPARGQREFRQRGQIEVEQQAHRPAHDLGGGGRGHGGQVRSIGNRSLSLVC